MSRLLETAVDSETRERLRPIRLWHWNQFVVLVHRARKAWTSQGAAYLNEEAHEHLGYVQTLNDFFPVGDTAERDAER